MVLPMLSLRTAPELRGLHKSLSPCPGSGLDSLWFKGFLLPPRKVSAFPLKNQVRYGIGRKPWQVSTGLGIRQNWVCILAGLLTSPVTWVSYSHAHPHHPPGRCFLVYKQTCWYRSQRTVVWVMCQHADSVRMVMTLGERTPDPSRLAEFRNVLVTLLCPQWGR